jgi:hypothetical protein
MLKKSIEIDKNNEDFAIICNLSCQKNKVSVQGSAQLDEII